jgi:hypothetical protein
MRNITVPSDTRTLSVWKTPAPYVLCGAAFIIASTAFLLIFLICSAMKSSHSRQSEETNMKSVQGRESNICSDEKDEKLVVIMAGDAMPSYIATPSSLSK